MNQFKRLSTAAFHSRIRVAQKRRILHLVRGCVAVFHGPLHRQLGLGPLHQVSNREKPQKTAQIPQPQRIHVASRHAIQEQQENKVPAADGDVPGCRRLRLPDLRSCEIIAHLSASFRMRLNAGILASFNSIDFT